MGARSHWDEAAAVEESTATEGTTDVGAAQ
jgi:hypothetical protein